MEGKMAVNSVKNYFRVEKKDCDSMEMINYETYFLWIRKAKEDFLRHLGLNFEYFTKQNFNLVTSNVFLKCMSVCKLDDKIEIETLTDSVTDHSVYFTFIAKNEETKVTVFKIEMETVLVDSNGKSACFDSNAFSKLKLYEAK